MTTTPQTLDAGEVTLGPVFEGEGPLLQVEARVEGLSLADWAAGRQALVDGWVVEHGGVLLRGFRVEQPAEFQAAIEALCGGALDYTERSSPRSQVEGKIYTSTDHPASQSIYLHNEQSYNLRFPRNIAFYCHLAAETGGATPVADCRQVYRKLDPAIRRRFEEEGYLYVRNFHPNFGLSWREAFQTEDTTAVESYCAGNEIECEWLADGHLRTSQRRRAVARHPVCGEATWFNHLTFFHVSTLEPAVRDFMLAAFGEGDLPNNTFHRDGSPIAAEALDELRRLYAEQTASFPWRRGDVMLLDNMLTAHGRKPYSGPRKVLTAMARPTPWSEV
jgi:alpha-ketoglutarate-dependent taurine dioxygenase